MQVLVVYQSQYLGGQEVGQVCPHRGGGTGQGLGKLSEPSPGEVHDLEASVQVGELQGHLRRDVIPGGCGRGPVQQVQTGAVQTQAWGWEGPQTEASVAGASPLSTHTPPPPWPHVQGCHMAACHL